MTGSVGGMGKRLKSATVYAWSCELPPRGTYRETELARGVTQRGTTGKDRLGRVNRTQSPNRRGPCPCHPTEDAKAGERPTLHGGGTTGADCYAAPAAERSPRNRSRGQVRD